MKRVMSLAFVLTLMFSTELYAQTTNLKYDFVDAYERETWLEQAPEYINNQFLFTGVDYLKADSVVIDRGELNYLYRSQDGENWDLVREYEHIYRAVDGSFIPSNLPGGTLHLLSSLDPQISVGSQIVNTGNGYILRDMIADYGANQSGSEGDLYVYDSDLNPVTTCHFDRPIVQMSYVDGTCYIVLYNPYVLMKSTDFENWEVVGENLGVPITLGNRTIMRTYEHQGDSKYISRFYAKQNPILFVDGKEAQKIDVEGVDFNSLQVIGGFFMATNSTYIPSEDGENDTTSPAAFYYSKDGVYWAKQELTNQQEDNISNVPTSIYSIKVYNGKLYVENVDDEYYLFDLADLEANVPESDVYVQVGNEILGFDTPPVIENGHTLVPMRFVMEKMGAEVGWNAAQQSIAVQQSDVKIEMAISSFTAIVNNQPVTMDVPPMLVDGRTMVPLRFLSEELGYDVEWNDETNTAVIEANIK